MYRVTVYGFNLNIIHIQHHTTPASAVNSAIDTVAQLLILPENCFVESIHVYSCFFFIRVFFIVKNTNFV